MKYYRDHTYEYAKGYGVDGCIYALATTIFAVIAILALAAVLLAAMRAEYDGSTAGANAVTEQQLEQTTDINLL